MNELLAQIILADRNNDIEGWMKILIVVILAVFWALCGIIKARTQKSEESEEQLAERPVQRQPHTAASLQKEKLQQLRHVGPVGPVPSRRYRRQVEQLRRKISRPMPVASGITTEKKPMAIPAIAAPKEPRFAKLAPEVQPAIEELPELISKPLKKPEAKYTGIPAERPEAKYLAETLLDYTDPDELRRAILHYEILGKPLSLRGPGEHIIGL